MDRGSSQLRGGALRSYPTTHMHATAIATLLCSLSLVDDIPPGPMHAKYGLLLSALESVYTRMPSAFVLLCNLIIAHNLMGQ